MFSPDTYQDDDRPNATCTDCSADFSRADHDLGTLCDACSDRRDAHTSMLERRLTMATARPATPQLTPSEISLCVALMGQGWTLMASIERVQVLRSRLPFPATFRTFLAAPSTGRRLDAALADNARVDRELAAAESETSETPVTPEAA